MTAHQTGDYFAIKLDTPKNPSTGIFMKMHSISQILSMIDRHLIVYSPITTPVKHVVADGSSYNLLFVSELINVYDQRRVKIQNYLRCCKEIILTNIDSINNYDSYLSLEEKILSHIKSICRSVLNNNGDDFEYNVKFNRIAFIKIIYDTCNIIRKKHLVNKVSVISLSGNPLIRICDEQLLKGFPRVVTVTRDRSGTFKLIKADFDDYKKWWATLGSDSKKLLNVMISDQDWIGRLKSLRENENNGLLDGDELVTSHRIMHDKLSNKKIYEIIEIIEHRRGDHSCQLALGLPPRNKLT